MQKPTSLWDRLPKETDKAWAAFTLYRDMGPSRSLAKLGQKYDKSRQHFGPWSKKYGWQTRVAAWDQRQDELDRLARRRGRDQEIEAAAKRHIQLAQGLQYIGGQRLNNLKALEDTIKSVQAAIQQSRKPKETLALTGQLNRLLDRISARDAAIYVDKGVHLERLTLGEPSQIHEQRDADSESAVKRDFRHLLQDPEYRRAVDRAAAVVRGTDVKPRRASGASERRDKEPVDKD